MKKCLKYALILVLIHLLVIAINDCLLTRISGKYEGGLMLFGMIAIVFESPLLLIQHVFNISFSWPSAQYILYYYFFGSFIYFLIGLLIGYIREYTH